MTRKHMWPWISGIMLLIPEASYLPSEALEKVETRKIRITSCPQATSSSQPFLYSRTDGRAFTADCVWSPADAVCCVIPTRKHVNIALKEKKNSKREKKWSRSGLRCALTGHERSKAVGAYSSKTCSRRAARGKVPGQRQSGCRQRDQFKKPPCRSESAR